MPVVEPPRDCPRCPRLVAFREANRIAFPDFHNAPVPAFGSPGARLLVVGLAPGLKGANQTGRVVAVADAGALRDAAIQEGLIEQIACVVPGKGAAGLVDCRVTNA